MLTRAGYAGIQRYAAVWTGDNRSFWEHMAMAMPMVLNMGLSGLAFSGPDIGGFAHHTSAQLLVRWTQMGVFFPLLPESLLHRNAAPGAVVLRGRGGRDSA
ncbi:TIM-barrel domain-containing protein [Paenibacillus rhizoplanae]